jgi:hypothetical protein
MICIIHVVTRIITSAFAACPAPPGRKSLKGVAGEGPLSGRNGTKLRNLIVKNVVFDLDLDVDMDVGNPARTWLLQM